MKICALTSAFEVPMIVHGHSLLAALHVAGAQAPTSVPRVECLTRTQENKQFFHDPIYRPENGDVTLPELPGLGIDETKVEKWEAGNFLLLSWRATESRRIWSLLSPF